MKNIINWLRLAGTLGLNIYCLFGIINRHLYFPILSYGSSGKYFVSMTAISIIFLVSIIVTGLAIYSFSYVPDENKNYFRWTNPGVWFGFSILILFGIALIIEFYTSLGILKLP
jgi:magnesium-transporting ATPase (P-type)